jgi:CubicO group peptidase (beta-lactamase class C family)
MPSRISRGNAAPAGTTPFSIRRGKRRLLRGWQGLPLGAALLCSAGCAAAPRPAAQEPVGDGFAELLERAGIPGMSMAVIEDGRVRRARGFGRTEAGGGRAVDENTVFEAASLSKPVLAYLALRLVDAGRLELDRPLREYLAEPQLAADPRAAGITARTVLSHTTGLQNERMGGDPLALEFAPGERFRYSGEGYLYLGRVIEAVTRLPLPEHAAQAVFIPLGMRRSGYVWDACWEPNAAVGHDEYGAPLAPTRPRAARASTLQTTAADYGRFLAAVLRGTGLSARSHRLMLAGQVPVAPGVEWALGWGIESAASGPALWHHGDNSNTGFTAFAYGDPARGTGVVYFANSTAGLGIVHPVLARAPFSGPHPAADWIGYERFDAPSRQVRMALERRIREQGAAAGLALIEELRAHYPADAFGESLLNRLGYRLLSLGRADEAVVLFTENARRYPQSSNVYDSLGDGHAAAGNRDAALQGYRRSLQMDATNAHAREMIARLEAQPRPASP